MAGFSLLIKRIIQAFLLKTQSLRNAAMRRVFVGVIALFASLQADLAAANLPPAPPRPRAHPTICAVGGQTRQQSATQTRYSRVDR